MFGNDGPKIQLPSLGHLINPAEYPDATIPVGVGNLWMELTAGVDHGAARQRSVPVVAAGDREHEAAAEAPLAARAAGSDGGTCTRSTGVVLAVVLICYVLSGLTWSRYWGENWRAFSSTVAPSTGVDAPSTPAKMGDYDRLGRRIAWAATDDPVYASQPGGPGRPRCRSPTSTGSPRTRSMVPGYAIIPPSDSTEGRRNRLRQLHGGQPLAAEAVSEQRTLYLDQFTGATITNATAAQDGALARLTSFGIAMHMGNQLGVLTRISATLACLGRADERVDRTS